MRWYSPGEMTRAGCTSLRGIRLWEDEGLLGEVERTKGGQRRYTIEQMDKARIIAAAQFGGWTLDEIRSMLAEWDDDVRLAILTRLDDQIRAAVRLGEQLPKAGEPVLEFDL